MKREKLIFWGNGAYWAKGTHRAHRTNGTKGPHGARYWLVILSIFQFFNLSIFLVSCEKAEQAYSNHVARFSFSPTNTVPQLNAALNNPGQFCTIAARNSQYVFHSPGIREDYKYTLTELDRKSKYVLGLSGFIVGIPIMADQLSAQSSVVCFDLACPNCYEEASITRDLTLLENQRAKCGRCGRLYDLNNQGIITDGEQGTSLYRYRIQYYPSGNNMTVNN